MIGAPKAIKARFADWRPVKGRKVLQVILEVPLEQQGEVLTMLGAPLPDRDLWVGVAVLQESKNDDYKGGPLARRAGILCSEPGFQRWVADQTESEQGGPEAAAHYVRHRCGVTSRAQIDHDDTAAREMRNINTEYQNWLRDAA